MLLVSQGNGNQLLLTISEHELTIKEACVCLQGFMFRHALE